MVYFIVDEANGRINIGSSRNVPRRLQTLQTGSSSRLTLVGASDWMDEASLHREFAAARIVGEWFSLAPMIKQAIDACEIGIDRLLGREVPADCHPITRHKGGFTLNDVAVKAAVSHGYIKQVAAGIRRPSFDIADRIAGVIAPQDKDAVVLAIMRFQYRRAA